MSEIWISMREKKLSETLTLMTDTLTRVTAERDESRRQSDLQMKSAIKFCSERNEARIERDKLAAELKSLRDSGVALPDPEINTASHINMRIVGYTKYQMLNYGDRRAMAERERAAMVCDAIGVAADLAADLAYYDADAQNCYGKAAGAEACAEAIRKGEKS
jgi:hypothetical protein